MADELSGERDFNQRNIDEFRANGGKVGGQFEGFPLLLLTSTGAKSGQQRINPVAYFDIDDRLYIVGSSAGRDSDPSWAFNIRAHPQAGVEIGADRRDLRTLDQNITARHHSDFGVDRDDVRVPDDLA